MFQRPGRPSDPIPGPFPNDQAARAANNGALPPDLSMIVKAREGGPDYVFGILTGYKDPPPGFNLLTGMYYNEYFPGHQIAMPPPLSDNAVTFADGTSATVPQMAHDVVTFLTWAAEPNLEPRHRTGFKVMLFLIIMAGHFLRRQAQDLGRPPTRLADDPGPSSASSAAAGSIRSTGLRMSNGGGSKAHSARHRTNSASERSTASRSCLFRATAAGTCCRRRRSITAPISMR